MRYLVAAVALCAACKSKGPSGPPQVDDLPDDPAPPVIDEPLDAAPPPVDAPPPDEPPVAYDTGAAACDAYLALFDTIIARCAKELGPALEAMEQARDAQIEAFQRWDSLGPRQRADAIQAATPGCRAAVDAITQSATSLGCTIK